MRGRADCRRVSCRSLSLPERDLRSANGGGRRAAPFARASPTSSSAICSLRTSGPTASRNSPAPALHRCFPLWERPTLPLAHAMIASGMQAYLATVDLKKLPAEFAGRKFDLHLLADLPRRRRSLRRERRVSYLRGGGADFFTPACGCSRRARPARRLWLLRSGDDGLAASAHAMTLAQQTPSSAGRPIMTAAAISA